MTVAIETAVIAAELIKIARTPQTGAGGWIKRVDPYSIAMSNTLFLRAVTKVAARLVCPLTLRYVGLCRTTVHILACSLDLFRSEHNGRPHIDGDVLQAVVPLYFFLQ